MSKHKVLSKRQFGFRFKTETQNAFRSLTISIYNYINNRQTCIVVFVDLAKAFDTVRHNQFVQKLNKMGIRSKANY